MNLPIFDIEIDDLPTLSIPEKNITVQIARLDKIHPQVSGNKIYKLHYFIKACLASSHKTILTYGGAFSNHLVATAFYCQQVGIKCIAVVRGNEQQKFTSHTLASCEQLGMKLIFVDRELYKLQANKTHENNFNTQFGDCTIIPEGGFAADGAKGAALIVDSLKKYKPTHICCAVGTATTIAGLMLANCNAQIIAVPAIKNMLDIEERILNLIGTYEREKLTIFNEFHFGGYAKYNQQLIAFMNQFYKANNIPTDFIYTAKMMYTIQRKLQEGFFTSNSSIICLHTGGLQGNATLPKNTLIF